MGSWRVALRIEGSLVQKAVRTNPFAVLEASGEEARRERVVGLCTPDDQQSRPCSWNCGWHSLLRPVNRGYVYAPGLGS